MTKKKIIITSIISIVIMVIVTIVFISINKKYIPGPNSYKKDFELANISIYDLLKNNNVINDEGYEKEYFDISLNYKNSTNNEFDIRLFRNETIEKFVVGNNAVFEKNTSDNYLYNYIKNLKIESLNESILLIYNTKSDECVEDDGYIQIYNGNKSLRLFNIVTGYYENGSYIELDSTLKENGFDYYKYDNLRKTITKIHLYDLKNIKEETITDVIENIQLCKQ